MKPCKAGKGFTLIELMIVVAVISLLALIVAPKFALLLTRSKESTILGEVGALRSAVSVYYSDNEGSFPTSFITALTTNSKYMASIPYSEIPTVDDQGNPGHRNLNGALEGDGTVIAPGEPNPVNMWYYMNQGTNIGTTLVNCTHKDTKGRIWSSY